MNILTFDIEEWFHILDNESTKTEKQWNNFEDRLHANMDRIFEVLAKHDQSATFFCLGWVARKYPDIVRKIDTLGYQVGTHSDMHQLVYEQSPEEFRRDLDLSIDAIEDAIGKKITAYRAPGFSVKEENKWVFEQLIEKGIEQDCSIFPAQRAHGGFENYGTDLPSIIETESGSLREFPINLYRTLGRNIIFSGGGYFRLLPYPAIKRMTKRSDYVMTYFHPRDFDADQPVIENLSAARRFKSYYGLSGSLGKLEKFLRDFEFIDLASANDLVDWENARRIVL